MLTSDLFDHYTVPNVQFQYVSMLVFITFVWYVDQNLSLF